MSDTQIKPSFDIPQADSLPRIVAVARFLQDGAKTISEIEGACLGLGSRNVHYYLHAVESLGFASRSADGNWELLPIGRELAESGAADEVCILTRALYGSAFCGKVIDLVKHFPLPGATHEDVEDVLGEISTITGSTLVRRASTVLGWMTKLGLVSRSKGYYAVKSGLLDDAGIVLRPAPPPRPPRKPKVAFPFSKIVELDDQTHDLYIEYSAERAEIAELLDRPFSGNVRVIDGHECRSVPGLNPVDARAFVELLGGKAPEVVPAKTEEAASELPCEPVKRGGKFRFRPGFKKVKARGLVNFAPRTMETSNRHSEIQAALYKTLAAQYGVEAVGTELRTSSGGKLDLGVELSDSRWFYEIKPYADSHDCIREATAQLLAYAYWPDLKGKCANPERLIVIGEAALDEGSKGFLRSLQKRNIPLYYQQIDVETATLGVLYPEVEEQNILAFAA